MQTHDGSRYHITRAGFMLAALDAGRLAVQAEERGLDSLGHTCSAGWCGRKAVGQ